jgi:hypothetical protein
MPSTLSAFDAVLKEDYHGPVVEQLNNSNMFAAQVDKRTEDFVGRRFVTPIHVSRNTGIGARAEGGTLPTAGNQGYVDVIGPVRYQYARIQLSTAVMKAAGKDRGSFIRALDSEMKGAVNDASRNECRMTWGKSTGELAQCGTTTAANVVVLAATTGSNQLRWIQDVGLVTIGTAPATPTSVAAERTVTAVDFANKTITISGAAVTTSASHFIFASGSAGASNNAGNPGDGQIELTGIQTMVDDAATVHTVTVASQPRWRSQVYASVGAISENALIRAMNDTEVASGESVNLLVSSYGVFRAVSNLFTTNKRFVNSVELKGGYKAVTVDHVLAGGKGSNSVALAPCRDTPDGTMWGFNTEHFKYYTLQEWDWMDQDGAVLSRVSNTAAYEATLEKMGDLAVTKRNAHFKLTGITEA